MRITEGTSSEVYCNKNIWDKTKCYKIMTKKLVNACLISRYFASGIAKIKELLH